MAESENSGGNQNHLTARTDDTYLIGPGFRRTLMPEEAKAAPVRKKAAAPATKQQLIEEPPGVAAKVRNARLMAGAVLAAVAGTEFVAVALTRDVLVAALWGVFGVGSVLLAWYIYRGRFTAWGTAMILDAFALLIALLRLEFAIIGAVIASFVVLYVFRLPFGVGAWKIEADKENAETRRLIGERTQNALGARCPKCGSDRLWIGTDGSAFCLGCRAGTIELAGRAL